MAKARRFDAITINAKNCVIRIIIYSVHVENNEKPLGLCMERNCLAFASFWMFLCMSRLP